MTRLITELPQAPGFPVDVALTCEGCGCLFSTWAAYEDLDERAEFGLGICSECDVMAGETLGRMLLPLFRQIRDATSKPETRRRWDAMSFEQKQQKVYRLLDRGLLTWSIGAKS
ncbi:MAG: hypothetical protein K0U93_22940 [Gammaproteobacteria bacterium]|nr:hypothetical protein [Gammaproteobacteria bacterium]